MLQGEELEVGQSGGEAVEGGETVVLEVQSAYGGGDGFEGGRVDPVDPLPVQAEFGDVKDLTRDKFEVGVAHVGVEAGEVRRGSDLHGELEV